MACNECLSKEEVLNLINNTMGSSSSGTGSLLFPTGMITFISNSSASSFDATGLGSGSFAGWAIANGNNGTVNWSGKYVVARDPGDTNFSTADSTGGSKVFTLTESQLPAHSHTDAVSNHSHTMVDPQHSHTGSTSTELSTVTLTENPATVVNVNDGSPSVSNTYQTVRLENDESGFTDPQDLDVLVRSANNNLTPLATGTLINIGSHAQSTVTIPAHDHGSLLGLSHSHTPTIDAASTGVTTNTVVLGGNPSSTVGSGAEVTHLTPYVVGIPIQKL